MATKSGKPNRLISRRAFIAGLSASTVACGIQPSTTEATHVAAPTTLDISQWLKAFDGRVITKLDENYEHWRTSMPWQMWTADRYPLMIVRPNSRQAAVDAVRFAKANNLKVVVKSGGHNVSEAFLRNDSMLLDLGELQGVDVDTNTKTAWVEPSLWGHFFLERLKPYNLAFPIAHCATVSMGGYLLGGGVGLNGDEWGSIGCDSILEAEIITADGDVVIATEDNHPELLWAVRGAGTGFFGIVTRYKLRLYDLPSNIYESVYFFPLKDIKSANQFLMDIAATGVRKTELMMLLAHNPMAPVDALPIDQKMCVARIVTFADSEKEAKELLLTTESHPLTSRAVMKQEMQPSSFAKLGEGSIDAKAGLGFGRYAVDTVWTNKPTETLEHLKEVFTEAPSHGNHVVVSYKINPRLPKNSAYSVIASTFIGVYAVWQSSKNDMAQFTWTENMGRAILPFAEGQYINEVNGFKDASSIKRCYSVESWNKLRSLRNQYDPEGLFHDFHGLS